VFGQRKIAVVLSSAMLLAGVHTVVGGSQAAGKRRVTVADTIRMTTVVETSSAAEDALGGCCAHFSPDGKRFAVVLEKGNLETGENEYSLLLFETAKVFAGAKPKLLVSMASRSNRDGIAKVKWRDNETLYFLGEDGDAAQVYSVDAATGRRKQWTQQRTAVVDFDVDPQGDLVYAAEPGPPGEKAIEEKIRRGYAITTETLGDIPQGRAAFREPDPAQGEEVFVQRRGERARRVVLRDRYLPLRPISLAPDGRHAVAAVFVRDVPPAWGAYEDPLIQAEAHAYRRKGTIAWVMRYMLIDMKSGEARPLLAGPIESGSSGTAWSNDGLRIAVSGAFLPLDVPDPAERDARRKYAFTLLLDLRTGNFEKITDKRLMVVRWDEKANRLYFRSPVGTGGSERKTFAKEASGWTEAESTQNEGNRDLPEIVLQQGLNTPPKLCATAPAHTREAVLVDLNPQFAQFEFGKVEVIRWKATDGHEVEGDLYLPPDYREGVRYPLVLQTHASTRTEFWINGPWNSAFAAQPLAAHGIVVLQVGHGTEPGGYMKHHRSLEEAPREMAAYEGAIDYLAARGIIDRERVGIIGFSRTQYHVEYTLTHSSYPFAAATLADGFDGGYFQYLVDPYSEKDAVFVNGGPPFGPTFANWLEHSPSFRLDHIRAPVRVESYGGVLGGWEAYSVLTHLGRPVELLYLPDAPHLLVKPWERLTSEQGNVDWFRFWLKGEEDPDPEKREQYERWRAMRGKLQQQDPSGHGAR
jgi:dipeptidyl aminopeptidase/acylaminoacyl peptidase